MDIDEALDFLRQHQPMPADLEISQSQIDKYDDVRQYFKTSPDVRSVPLLLNSFGDGDGLGVYQLVEDTLQEHDYKVVVAELQKSLNSAHMSVRTWSAEIAMTFPDPKLVPQLARNLESRNYDLKAFSLYALELNLGELPLDHIQRFIATETDEDLVKLASEILQKRHPPN